MTDFHDIFYRFKGLLSEDPDRAWDEKGRNIAEWPDDDAIAFGYFKGDMYAQDTTHGEMKTPDGGMIRLRDKMQYPGRLWYRRKLISFWEFPPRNKLLKVMKDVEDAWNSVPKNRGNQLRIGKDWKVEVPETVYGGDGAYAKGGAVNRVWSYDDLEESHLYTIADIVAGKPLQGIGALWKDLKMNVDTGKEHMASPVKKKLDKLTTSQKRDLWNYYKNMGSPSPADKALYRFMQRNVKEFREMKKSDLRQIIREEIQLIRERDQGFTTHHPSFTSAVADAQRFAVNRGYEVDEDEWFRQVSSGPRKPSPGKQNSYKIELTKGGKPQRRMLVFQVYNLGDSYELNAYIS